MIVVGLTGGFGTGKTTVREFFRSLGAAFIIDADRIVREVTAPRAAATREIREAFGKTVLDEGGGLNRQKLSALVFKDRKLLKKLCSIVHPTVLERIKQDIAAAEKRSPRGIFIVEAPLLFEVGLDKDMDVTVVVSASRERQATRLQKMRGLSTAEVEERINAQLPLAEKERRADFVIDNNSSLDNTRRQVESLWKELKERTYKL